DHLRDRGHLHHPGAECSDRASDQDANHDHDQPGRREVQQRNRGSDRDHHPRRGREVAVPRALGRAELLEAEDEQHSRDEISERYEEIHLLAGRLAAWRPLNISSIRSVTTNPPTTLVVARITATRPSAIVSGELAPAAITRSEERRVGER